MIVIVLKFGLGCWTRIIDVMDLFIKSVAHDKRIGQCQAVGLHWVPFLGIGTVNRREGLPVH